MGDADFARKIVALEIKITSSVQGQVQTKRMSTVSDVVSAFVSTLSHSNIRLNDSFGSEADSRVGSLWVRGNRENHGI